MGFNILSAKFAHVLHHFLRFSPSADKLFLGGSVRKYCTIINLILQRYTRNLCVELV